MGNGVDPLRPGHSTSIVEDLLALQTALAKDSHVVRQVPGQVNVRLVGAMLLKVDSQLSCGHAWNVLEELPPTGLTCLSPVARRTKQLHQTYTQEHWPNAPGESDGRL